MLGFALFYNNLLSGDFDRSRFYRRCTGKQMILEMWDDEKIWGKGRTTKDEDRVTSPIGDANRQLGTLVKTGFNVVTVTFTLKWNYKQSRVRVNGGRKQREYCPCS